MRKVALAAGVIAALLVGAGPALAFQETPEAPPEALSVAPDPSKAPAMQMQTPATGPPPPNLRRRAERSCSASISCQRWISVWSCSTASSPWNCSRPPRYRKTMTTLPCSARSSVTSKTSLLRRDACPIIGKFHHALQPARVEGRPHERASQRRGSSSPHRDRRCLRAACAHRRGARRLAMDVRLARRRPDRRHH